MKPRIIIPALILSLGLVLQSCSKRGEEAQMEVRLTDAPGDFEEVNVDVQGVEIHWAGYTNGNTQVDGEWIALDTRTGIYDLLLLQNGVDTVVTPPQTIPAGKVTQVRILLGDQNTVVVDGIVYPLVISSQDETGLKVNVNRVLDPDEMATLLLDFDAAASVHLDGSGTYRLKPVLRLIQ